MMPGYARICPDDARTMPGYARMPDSPDDARYRLAAGSVRRLRDGMRAAQRQLSAALLAGVKIGTAGGTESPPKIAPSPEAAPAASAAKQCWAAIT